LSVSLIFLEQNPLEDLIFRHRVVRLIFLFFSFHETGFPLSQDGARCLILFDPSSKSFSQFKEAMMNAHDDRHSAKDQAVAVELRQSGEVYARTLLAHPSLKEATKAVERHAGENFDQAYAGEVEELTQECQELDQRVSHSAQRLVSLEKKESQTNATMKVSELRGTGEHKALSFGQWELKDQLVFPLTLIFMALVLGAGSANVFSAIMAQGEPIFLENPILAVFLACLLPGGAAAIHSFGDLLQSDRSRHRYTLFILGSTVVSLLAWTGLFAMNFPIGSDEVNLDRLEEDSDLIAMAFTFVQLLTEVLCGASLALTASYIHSRYCAESFIRTPEFLDLSAQIQERLPTHEALHAKRSQKRGRLMQLRAMRAAHISDMVALYQSLRRRFDELSPTGT
jgi:hypothetical protein